MPVSQRFLLFCLLVISILLMISPVYATIIFSDGYETNDHSAWTSTGTSGGGSLSEVLSTSPYTGTYCGHYYRTSGSDTANGGWAYKTFTAPSNNIVWARTFVRITSFPATTYAGANVALLLWTGTASQTHAFIDANAACGSNTFELMYYDKAGNLQTVAQVCGQSQDTYYKLEIKMDKSSSNPVITYWINDVQKGTYTDTSTGTYNNPTRIDVGAFMCPNCGWYTGTGDIRVDDVLVADDDPDKKLVIIQNAQISNLTVK